MRCWMHPPLSLVRTRHLTQNVLVRAVCSQNVFVYSIIFTCQQSEKLIHNPKYIKMTKHITNTNLKSVLLLTSITECLLKRKQANIVTSGLHLLRQCFFLPLPRNTRWWLGPSARTHMLLVHGCQAVTSAHGCQAVTSAIMLTVVKIVFMAMKIMQLRIR